MDKKGAKIIERIQMLESLIQEETDEEIIQNLENRLAKLKTLQEMRQKLITQENILKINYLSIIKERNLYFEKLRLIESYGEENKWKDPSGLLQKIHLHLINLRK